ncbi:coiled-coil domain-containing protein 169-like [Gastrophryne carolinensis]
MAGSRAPAGEQQLLEDLQVERRKKEMLQTSLYELKSTVAELERKLNGVNDEGNEWRTRYETQIELNRQLERQIHRLQETTEHIRGNPTDRLSSIRSYEQMPVAALNQYLRRLEEEKTLMENQLKDFELRIEQETKAYYKVNDERRMYISEIAQTSDAQDAVKKQSVDPVKATREKPGNNQRTLKFKGDKCYILDGKQIIANAKLEDHLYLTSAVTIKCECRIKSKAARSTLPIVSQNGALRPRDLVHSYKNSIFLHSQEGLVVSLATQSMKNNPCIFTDLQFISTFKGATMVESYLIQALNKTGSFCDAPQAINA